MSDGELNALLFLLRTEAVGGEEGGAGSGFGGAEGHRSAPVDTAAPDYVGSSIGKEAAAARVLEVFDYASANGRVSEPTYTAAAAVACAAGDASRGVALMEEMATSGVPARHRSYAPVFEALAAAGRHADAEKLLTHMSTAAIEPLPPTAAELTATLRAAAAAGEAGAARPLLDRILNEVSLLPPAHSAALARWFRESAPHAPALKAEGAQASGSAGAQTDGWRVEERVQLSADGVCPFFGTRMDAVFLSEGEYGEFKSRVDSLAEKRASNPEQLANLKSFLARHGPFEVVIDAANVALYNQNFAGGGFNVQQIEQLVAQCAAQIPGACHPPLVILHENRVSTAMKTEEGRRVLGVLKKHNCLFATPRGANDDWYWLYAAVAAGDKGLLVSNDQMRDHLFQMLRPREFVRYRARHQVKYDFNGARSQGNKLGCQLYLPKPYTECMQVHDDGATWHVPVSEDDSGEVHWVCAHAQGSR